jgi:hypothetical protein
MVFLRSLVSWLLHPRRLFVLLPAFMLLLVAGTWAQKSMGLFPATARFFNAWFFWVGPVPLPAGVTLLALIGLNMTAHFITKSQWRMPGLGTTLTHAGVLVLLAGGAITLYAKDEGFVILRYGQPTAVMVDYHARVLTVTHNGKATALYPHDDLYIGQKIDLGPTSLVIERIFRNSALKPVAKRPQNCAGIACSFALVEKKPLADDESNQMGLVLRRGNTRFIMSEFINGPITIDGWQAAFTRVSWPLPFVLSLTGFAYDTHPGSDMAKSYRTDLTLRDGTQSADHSIAMNAPLRYGGYTFYQASMITLATGEIASVLNAVKNPAWIFPYAATCLFLVGFLVHVWGRRHA